MKGLYSVNKDVVNAKNIYIFGTGWHAKQTYIELSSQGIGISGFADRGESEINRMIYGLPVISEEELISLHPIVIVASISWKSICERLEKAGLAELYVDKSRYGEVEVEYDYLRSVGQYLFEKDTLYILCPAGIGDTLYVAAYVQALKKEGKYKKVNLFTKESHECFKDLFNGIDDVISDNGLVDILESFSINTGTWRLKNYLYGHMKKNKCHTFLSEYYDNKELKIIEYYKKVVLGLSDEAKMSEMISKTINNAGETRKIVLFPYALTSKMLPKTFWEEITFYYIEKRFDVYTNVKDQTECVIPGTKEYMGTIEETIRFCDNSCVLALRSGMCDVLAMSGARVIVLDTDEEFYNKWNLAGLPGSKAVHIRCFDVDEAEIKRDIYEKIK